MLDGDTTPLPGNTSTTPPGTNITVGRYRLLRRIGRGGMGEVWLAEDPRLRRQVAIKTLPLLAQSDQEFSRRFEQEARAAAALNHPHILPVHDYGEQRLPNGQVITYIVMAYVPGGSLAERIAMLESSGSGMPPDEAIHFLSQAAEAIDYAHSQGVLHRDIKPNNMLLRSDNWLLLADFGIARMLSDAGQNTQTGMGFGTPEYMAPEQAQGNAEAASDNYSLAVIAYQLFTRQLPFSADTPYATTMQHIITPPPPPRQINPSLSLAVERALLHGLAKDPAQRPPSARAFVNELQNTLTGAPFEATRPNQPPPPPGVTPMLSTDGQRSPSLSPAGDGKIIAGITRRQMLIGGGVALLAIGVVGAGLEAWALGSAQHASQSRTPVSAPIANPDSPILTLHGHNQPITSLTWSPSPTAKYTLASAAAKDAVLLWDISAIQQGQASPNQPLANLTVSSTTALVLAWSPGGDKLAIGNPAFEINPQNPNLIDTKLYVYTGDLRTFAPGYDDNLIFPKTVFIKALSWAPGKYFITASRPYSSNNQSLPYSLEVWDPGQPEQKLTPFFQVELAYELAASPDGSTLAVAEALGVTIVQLSVSGKIVHWKTLFSHLKFGSDQYPASAVTWSPSGQYVAAITYADLLAHFNVSPASRIGIWDWKSGTEPAVLPTLPDPQIFLTTLAWSPAPTSTLLAAGSKEGKVYIWSIDPQSSAGNTLPTRTLRGLNAQVQALAWSADGHFLAAGYNDTNDSILIWKV